MLLKIKENPITEKNPDKLEIAIAENIKVYK
jgi:hypothetical protein